MAHHQTLQIINNFVLLAIGIAIFVTCYAGQPPCQQVTTPNTLDSNQSFYYLPFIMPTRSKEVKRRKKEEEAMAVAMLQKEKEATKRLQREEEAKAAAALAVSATEEVHWMVAIEQAALPPVVSPPSASNLNSLLTGHVGQDGETSTENGSLAVADNEAQDTSKSPKKKIQKNPNPTNKAMLLSAITVALP
jgi:hypothetical protein